MSSFRQKETEWIEYRQTGWLKATNICIAGVIFSAGILCLCLFIFNSKLHSMRVVVLAGCIMVGGIYYLATVLRTRILIEGTRIAVGNAFGERSATVSEIEGVRDIHGKYGESVTGKLLCLKDGRTISISLLALDLDDRFFDWLKQLPSLD
jgi:hypothetical protein